jgi:signal peptidase I
MDFGGGPRASGTEGAVSDPVGRAVLELWAARGRRNRFPIAGNSMRPLIHHGDVALVVHGTAGVRVGAIILFRQKGGLIAHRVLHRARRPEGDVFFAQGDNAAIIDEVQADHVIGRVLAVQRGDRHLRLDTRLWMALGWLIATATWRWSRLYRRGWALKQQRLGPAPNRISGRLRRLGIAVVKMVITGAELIGGRWREGVAPEPPEGPPTS